MLKRMNAGIALDRVRAVELDAGRGAVHAAARHDQSGRFDVPEVDAALEQPAGCAQQVAVQLHVHVIPQALQVEAVFIQIGLHAQNLQR